MEEKVSICIQKVAKKLTQKTIGKSVPIIFHELEIPEEVRKWAKEEE